MDAQWAPEPGTVLNGRYKIHDVFDRGGMGVVARATHLQMEREVAVKLLMPGFAEKERYRTRFEREVRLITRVSHPNVVQCFDYGTTPDGLLFIVMELLNGDSLAHRLATNGRLDAEVATVFALQLADSLAAAHRVGVVHRDVKPGNVFVTKDFRGEELIKLLDFGIARPLIGESIRVTASGSVVGTPSYLAPEVLLGADAAEAADIYAWGLVVLEMMTGQKVFGGPGVSMTDTFAQQLFAEARIPARLWDHPLGQLASAALAKQPWNRPTAEEIYQKLRAAEVPACLLAVDELPPPITEAVPTTVLNQVADRMTVLERLPAPVRWEGHADQHKTIRIVAKEITDTLTEQELPTRPSEQFVPTAEVQQGRGRGAAIGLVAAALLAVGAYAAVTLSASSEPVPAAVPQPGVSSERPKPERPEPLEEVVAPAPELAEAPEVADEQPGAEVDAVDSEPDEVAPAAEAPKPATVKQVTKDRVSAKKSVESARSKEAAPEKKPDAVESPAESVKAAKDDSQKDLLQKYLRVEVD